MALRRVKRLFTILIVIIILHAIARIIFPQGSASDDRSTQLFPKSARNFSQSKTLKTKKLLILTYYRSGSTFTGDILQQSPDVFYLFEPIRYLRSHYESRKTVVHLQNLTTRLLKKESTEFYNILRAWFSCRTGDIDHAGLYDNLMNFSLTTRPFWKCIRQPLPYTDHYKRTLSCLTTLESKCKTSSHRHIKSIRVSMRTAVKLLKEFDDLVLLHLIRDPRGVFASRTHYVERGSDEMNITKYCSLLLEDVLESERWQTVYPHRIRRVFYEDIATRPMELSALLYKYAGLEFSDSAKVYIRHITSSRVLHPEQCIVCTTKKDSSTAASEWRTYININLSRSIDDICSKVYDKVGYIKFDNRRDLTNISIPSRRRIYTDIDIAKNV